MRIVYIVKTIKPFNSPYENIVPMRGAFFLFIDKTSLSVTTFSSLRTRNHLLRVLAQQEYKHVFRTDCEFDANGYSVPMRGAFFLFVENFGEIWQKIFSILIEIYISMSYNKKVIHLGRGVYATIQAQKF